MENTIDDDVKQHVGDSLNEIRDELGERAQELRDTVNNFVDAKPFTAVGLAFGVGYLLSGALFSRTTFKAARLGARVAFGGLLKQLVAGIGPEVLAAISGERRGNGHGTKSQQH